MLLSPVHFHKAFPTKGTTSSEEEFSVLPEMNQTEQPHLKNLEQSTDMGLNRRYVSNIRVYKIEGNIV